MRYLIDGYNLLHAMGALGGRKGPGGLERARQRLLGLLSGAYGRQASAVTVVFDAAEAPRDVPAEQDHQGIHVRFAHRQEADDLIEQLIRHTGAPRRLTVVSDDHRIQAAARRRRCLVAGCTDYLAELDRRYRRRRTPPGADAKPERPSRRETQHWLHEFADLSDDPSFKDLAEPREFFEEPDS
ncbi:MAG TPA: NYN domain-containing protein [Gemmataceae bacterium]|nr:NYN domain-containing protein [Gemmataceae bacterium]